MVAIWMAMMWVESNKRKQAVCEAESEACRSMCSICSIWDNEQTGRYLYSIQGKWERAGIHTEKGKNKMWCLE